MKYEVVPDAGAVVKRARGRPRAYDADMARIGLRDVFWRAGYAATSLDQLAAAVGMNRPSLYAAFGDKRAMYVAAIDSFIVDMRAGVEAALCAPILKDALHRFYSGAIDLYLSGDTAPRGCLLVCTAVVDSTGDIELRRKLRGALDEIDAALVARVVSAQQTGDLPSASDARVLGRIAGSMLHSVAVRARLGVSRRQLKSFADDVVRMICGSEPGGSRGRPKQRTDRVRKRTSR